MLRMFYDGSDYVTAHDPLHAVSVWEEESGPRSIHPSRQTGDVYHHEYEFEECPGEEMCAIFLENEGLVTKMYKEWIEHFGNKAQICFSENW